MLVLQHYRREDPFLSRLVGRLLLRVQGYQSPGAGPRKTHIQSADRIYEGNSVYVAKIFEAIPKIAEKLDLGRGYRVITNIGEHGCQSVQHLHFHLLGGAQLPDRMN